MPVKNARTVTIDFVARSEVEGEWQCVLVEAGPWTGPIQDELRRIQARLYDVIDGVLAGHFAEKFPEALGKRIVIQLDGYNLPRPEVQQFFTAFADGVFKADEYKAALAKSPYVSDVSFRLELDSIN